LALFVRGWSWFNHGFPSGAMNEEAIMQEVPLMAVRPSDIKVTVVRDSSTSTGRERGMSHHFPSLGDLIGSALSKLEADGYSLLDIRYSAIPTGGEGYEHFAMIIGRRSSGESAA
jgi:hypothetical protein